MTSFINEDNNRAPLIARHSLTFHVLEAGRHWSASAMDEIFALQAALSAAQEQKSQIRLSERNIVELVNKLKVTSMP